MRAHVRTCMRVCVLLPGKQGQQQLYQPLVGLVIRLPGASECLIKEFGDMV